jgi:hypothetical protein
MLARTAGRLALGPGERHVRRVDLLRRQHPDREGEVPLVQASTELGRLTILGVGQDAAEASARGQHTIDLLERDPPLGTVDDPFGHTGPRPPLVVGAPVLRQEQAQADADRHLSPGQGERDQRLAVRPLAQLAAVLPFDPDRVLALLDQGGVVDHQHRVRPADQPVGGLHQLVLQRGRRPGRGRDEVVQLLRVAWGHPRRHRLDALALAGQDQALEVERRPASLGLTPQALQERLQPAFQLLLPTLCRWSGHHAPPPRASLGYERSASPNVAG